MKDTAVVFVTDKGFLVPSLVAALQVAEQPEATLIADIFIVLIDVDSGIVTSLASLFRDAGLSFVAMNSSLFLPPDDTFFNKTHVPRTALGRLALHHVLPAQYENVVYLDGDTQISGDITALLRHRVRPGHIAAVPEGNWLCEGDIGHYWPKHKAYMAALGIDDPHNYFNSGVLAFRMDTWREMAPRALEYFARYPERCIYHDQSALNAVFAGRYERLSPIYNFVLLYAELAIEDKVKPRIFHFTGGDKPWNYVGPPWNGRFTGAYRAFLETYPTLSAYLPLQGYGEPAEKPARRLLSLLKKPVSLWRRARRKARLREYIAGNNFAMRD